MKGALAFLSLLAVTQAHLLIPIGPNGAVYPRRGILNPPPFFGGTPFGQVPVFVITQPGLPGGFPGAPPGVPDDGKKCTDDDKPGDGGSKPGDGAAPKPEAGGGTDEDRKDGEEPTPTDEPKPTEEPSTTEEPKPAEEGDGKEADTPGTEGQGMPDEDDSSEELKSPNDTGVENRAGEPPIKPAGPGGPARPALPRLPTFQFLPVFDVHGGGHPFVYTVLSGPSPHGALPPGSQPPAQQPPGVDKKADGAPQGDGKRVVYGYFIPANGPIAPYPHPGVFHKPGHAYF